MTAHTLESLEQSDPLYPWVATCSCHNPDSEGIGRADFGGDTALEAVQAWQEHADAQPDDLPPLDGWVRVEDEIRTRVYAYRASGGTVGVYITNDGWTVTVNLSDEAWNTLRGVNR